MPPLDTESQFKFLIVCIKHSTAGKVDFGRVAEECEIVSKGAAAKRYERLMKAHGITTGGSGSGGVKKEVKDSKDGIKTRTPNKKRKLAAVDEGAGDVDEPIKTEIKGEVKAEDMVAVKAEQESGAGRLNDVDAGAGGGASSGGSSGASIDTAVAAPAVFVNGPPSAIGQRSFGGIASSPSGNVQGNIDDGNGDEVLVISATERRDGSSVPAHGGDDGHYNYHSHQHHHSHPNPHSPAPTIPGIRSFDYAANMGFPPQMSPTTTTTTTAAAKMTPPSHSPLPYGFPPSPWMYSHNSHGYL
ncbi:hypothetical protein GGS23DRAFT_595839 [Durotheca rogersii]|uniref:uncharacterized protein n=1 Tax=Durotheca rogersii TaxID=419775 RepID=UPI002220B256|nr:uncharacterized protein GGS23DRAFT_595839 [Durotheca rogersii]KAI5864202.1 hypothetical protein GGS23DRAFT_595839 [Durotheca rogersii]